MEEVGDALRELESKMGVALESLQNKLEHLSARMVYIQ